MSHNFEMGMFGNNQPAWHNLGKVLPHKVYSIEEALMESGITWTVDKQDIKTAVDNVVIPNTKALVRSTDKSVLGIVGDRYEVLQPSKVFEFFEPFLGEKMSHITSAISLEEGRKIVVSIELDDNVREIVNGDIIKNHVMLATSYDSSLATIVKSVNTRVVCANTLKSALWEKDGLCSKIRHTASQNWKLANVKALIQEQICTLDNDAEIYRRMANTPLDFTGFFVYLEDLFAKDLIAANKIKPTTLRDLRPTEQIIGNYLHTRDLREPGIADTMWSGFNAVTKYLTHQRGSQNTTTETRFKSVHFGAERAMLERAYKLSLERI